MKSSVQTSKSLNVALTGIADAETPISSFVTVNPHEESTIPTDSTTRSGITRELDAISFIYTY